MTTRILLLSLALAFSIAACKKGTPTPGLSFGSCEITWEDPVKEGAVRKAGDILLKLKQCRRHAQFLHMYNEKHRYKVRVVVKAGEEKRPGTAKPWYHISKLFSERIFKSRPVDVLLVDKDLKTLRILPFEKARSLFSEPKPVELDPSRLKRPAPAMPAPAMPAPAIKP